jgi:hypothetical protein
MNYSRVVLTLLVLHTDSIRGFLHLYYALKHNGRINEREVSGGIITRDTRVTWGGGIFLGCEGSQAASACPSVNCVNNI